MWQCKKHGKTLRNPSCVGCTLEKYFSEERFKVLDEIMAVDIKKAKRIVEWVD